MRGILKFEKMRNTFLGKRDNKNSILKKTILKLCIGAKEISISMLSDALSTSIPTVTKLVGELIDEGFMIDLGKHGTSGGRRPSLYGLNPEAGYFIGVDIRHSHACVAVTDFTGSNIKFQDNIPFKMEPTEEKVHEISVEIRDFCANRDLDWNKVLGMGISVPGRVNPDTGYSNIYSFDSDRPINRILSDDLEIPVVIENDSRAMSYGEYIAGDVDGKKNVIVVNISWGLGMGLVLNGQLYYGASGFSGEIGHFPLLDNGIICRCGKVGCLETGASGSALTRMVTDQLRSGRASSLTPEFRQSGKVDFNDILRAIADEDMLCIEAVESIGETLGRGLAGLINVFNPEVVVIAGKLATVGGDYLMLPIHSAIRRYAQNIAIGDTKIQFTSLGNLAAPTGVALLCRSRLLQVL